MKLCPRHLGSLHFPSLKLWNAPLDMSVGYWAKNHLKLLNMLKEKNVMHQEIPKSRSITDSKKTCNRSKTKRPINKNNNSLSPQLQGRDVLIRSRKTITEAGVLKKLSLAGLAKLSRLRYSWLRFGRPQQAIVDSEPTIGWCTQPANTQLISRNMMKYLGLARLA